MEIFIRETFTSDELDQLAKETKFVRRSSGKINGKMFMDLIVFNNDCLKNQSLNDLTVILEERHNVQISKQSLHERFNEHALAFLKKALQSLLRKQFNINYLPNELQGIRRILIKDSVCFQVDQSFSDIYPGSSGSASEACVRIQFEFDLLNGKINDLSLSAYNDQDSKNSIETIEKTQRGDLIIRDLAYMELRVLDALIERAVCFLGRLNPKVYVYTKGKGENDYRIIDFSRIAKHMRKKNLEVMEKLVYLGKNKKLKVRLIIHLLPKDVVEKRMRDLKKKRAKKGKKSSPSEEYKARLVLNLFVTNTGREQISVKNVWNLYRLRWQIELVFKVWKSFCKIDKVKKVRLYRLQCYIYSKLIFILLGWQILWPVTILMEAQGKELSLLKAFKTLTGTKFGNMRAAFIKKKTRISEFILDFLDISLRKHLLEKRKKQPSSKQLLAAAISNEKQEKAQREIISRGNVKIA